jgi:RNA polymerase sigma-70 factor, ECF subfamily
MFAMTKAAEHGSSENKPGQPSSGPTESASEAIHSSSTEEEGQSPALSSTDWGDLVRRIQSGNENGMEDLYRIFSRGIRYYLCRQLGPQELDDKVHDSFLIVVQAIQRGDLREPDRLMGFIRTVVRRQVAAHIDDMVHSRREAVDIEVGSRIADRRGNPEQAVAMRQKTELLRGVLLRLAPKDREILTRFYLQEQTQEQICEEMNLTETQFRLLKSRAKARFGELGKKKLHGSLLSHFVRIS